MRRELLRHWPEKQESESGVREIETIVASMAQIPPKRVSKDDRSRLESLETDLKNVVFGQDEAVESLVGAIKLSRAGLRDPRKPIGCFLMTGPTGGERSLPGNSVQRSEWNSSGTT